MLFANLGEYKVRLYTFDLGLITDVLSHAFLVEVTVIGVIFSLIAVTHQVVPVESHVGRLRCQLLSPDRNRTCSGLLRKGGR
jgi:hypothetical protein